MREIYEILKEYIPMTDKILRITRSICSSLPDKIGNKHVEVKYYGTDYFSLRGNDRIYKSYRDGENFRFCQIGYEITTNNEFFGFNSSITEVFYILFCFLSDNYVLVLNYEYDDRNDNSYRYFKGNKIPILINDEVNKKTRWLRIKKTSVMERDQFIKYLKNPVN